MVEPEVEGVEAALSESGETIPEDFMLSEGMQIKVMSEFPLDAGRIADVAMKHSDGTVEGANEVLLRWGYPPTVVKLMDMTTEEGVTGD